MSLFIAYLHHEGFAPKTMSTYLSAIGYVHKLNSLPDPSTAFLVTKLVAGAYRLKPSFDTRLPITVPVLNKLLQSLPHVTTSSFEHFLFRSMFLLGFSAFARIGEITVASLGDSFKTMQLSDVTFVNSSVPSGGLSVEITFRFYKHNLTAAPYTISFYDGPAISSAVLALHDYVNLRGRYPGPLYCHGSKQPVMRVTFDKLLRRALAFSRLDS
ncbi:MAG: hypothetical protein ABW185_13080 [Sedimenticola sp.]